jgi:Pyruvate/2-oxoacid:ferredoxin oxidoreductase delta subunit
VYKEEDDTLEWVGDFCKGCQVCIAQCTVDGALVAAPELDFEGGVVRLEKPF